MPRRENTIAIARLVFIAIYAVAFIAAGFGHWSRSVFLALYVVVSVLWLVLLAFFIVELRQSRTPWAFTRQNPAIPLLLISPALPVPGLGCDLVRRWSSPPTSSSCAGTPRATGSRSRSRSSPSWGCSRPSPWWSWRTTTPTSQFRSPSDALYWAFGGLLRISTGRTYTPLTDDGRFLGIVVAVCGVIAASMFTAKLVTWVVGERKPVEDDDPPESAPDDLREQVAALQVDVDRLTAAAQEDRGP